MATGGGSNDPDNLSELPLEELLAGIARDHSAASDASEVQYRQLRTMGRKVAEVYENRGLSWRQIAAQTGLSVRTVRRYAKPFLRGKD